MYGIYCQRTIRNWNLKPSTIYNAIQKMLKDKSNKYVHNFYTKNYKAFIRAIKEKSK